MGEPRKYNLEERLIKFAIRMLEVSENLPKTYAGNHIAGQLIRSGTSPALNYGEAQAAESSKDFVHKMGIALKELRETGVCLKIIDRKPFLENTESIKPDLDECSELIAILQKASKQQKAEV